MRDSVPLFMWPRRRRCFDAVIGALDLKDPMFGVGDNACLNRLVGICIVTGHL